MSNGSNWKSNSCKFCLVFCIFWILFDMTSLIREKLKIKLDTIVEKYKILEEEEELEEFEEFKASDGWFDQWRLKMTLR